MVSVEISSSVGLKAALSGAGAVARAMAMQCLGWPLAAARGGPGLRRAEGVLRLEKLQGPPLHAGERGGGW